jgi:hypothetical protein
VKSSANHASDPIHVPARPAFQVDVRGTRCANRAGINPAPLRSSPGKPTELRRRLG